MEKPILLFLRFTQRLIFQKKKFSDFSNNYAQVGERFMQTSPLKFQNTNHMFYRYINIFIIIINK